MTLWSSQKKGPTHPARMVRGLITLTNSNLKCPMTSFTYCSLWSLGATESGVILNFCYYYNSKSMLCYLVFHAFIAWHIFYFYLCHFFVVGFFRDCSCNLLFFINQSIKVSFKITFCLKLSLRFWKRTTWTLDKT